MVKNQKTQKRSLVPMFLDLATRRQICALQGRIRKMYADYPKDSTKRIRLKNFAVDMFNSMQNEFYMSAWVCNETLWKWTDRLDSFDEYGYLECDGKPQELTGWTKLVTGWFNKQWTYEVLSLLKDFNLDNQKPEIVSMFMTDFIKIKSDREFYSTLLKWNDLIHWSPWKLEMFESTYCPESVSKYDNEFNPDYESYEYDGISMYESV